MRHKEYPQEIPLPELNQELLGGKLNFCTPAIFCAGASKGAKNKIAQQGQTSLGEVEKQALPLNPPSGVSTSHIGNYNNENTGWAFRELIRRKVLIIKKGHAEVNPLAETFSLC